MKIHLIQHVRFENPGAIIQWANQRGHQIHLTHLYNREKLPQISEIDFLIIMGGPQSLRELDKYPYLRDEIVLIQQLIAHKKRVLGICLGAQLIAESLGAATQSAPDKEIGVFPVQLTSEGEQDPVFGLFPKVFEVMHWHEDMPALPVGGVLLAQSKGCPHQAIRYSDRVYALQFHMEMTAELAQNMVEHCAQDLVPGKYIQEKTKILSADFKQLNNKLNLLLDYLAELS